MNDNSAEETLAYDPIEVDLADPNEEKRKKLIEKEKQTAEIYEHLEKAMPKIPSMYKPKSFKQKKSLMRKAAKV